MNRWPLARRMALAMALCLATRPLAARDFYLSPSGDDRNPATLAQPWQTLGQVNATSFAPGDRILLEGGATFAGPLQLHADDAGDPATPVTVDSWGTGRAVIDGGAGAGIDVYDTAGVEIRNLVVRGDWDAAAQSGNAASGVGVYMDLGGTTRLDHVRLENLDVSGFRSSGLFVGAWPADGSMSGFRDVVIEGCDSHDNGDAGISSYGYWDPASSNYAHRDLTVRRCRAYRNRGIAGTGNNSGNGIVLSGVDGALVELSEAFENGDLCDHRGGGPVGIWAWDARHVTIQRCESHHNRTGSASLDGGGFDLDGGVTDSLVQYNWSHDNDGAGYLVWQFTGARPLLGRNVIRYNLSQDDGRANSYGSIHAGGGGEVRDNAWYGNTIYVSPGGGTGAAAVRLEGIGTGNTFRNNCFVTSGGVALLRSQTAYALGSAAFQGNSWWAGAPADFAIFWARGLFSDLASFRTQGQEVLGASDTGLEADPLLRAPGAGATIANPDALGALDAYDPQPGSPLVDAGLDLLALFGTDPGGLDFRGTTAPQGPALDVGAVEVAPCTPPAGAAGLLRVFKPAAAMLFTWQDRTDATEYRVMEELLPSGAFDTTVAATASSGTPGATCAMRPGSLLFYQVIPWNSCGPGRR